MEICNKNSQEKLYFSPKALRGGQARRGQNEKILKTISEFLIFMVVIWRFLY